jgi:lipid-A-disaccharide synthase
MKILFITLEQSGRQIVKSILDDNFYKINKNLIFTFGMDEGKLEFNDLTNIKITPIMGFVDIVCNIKYLFNLRLKIKEIVDMYSFTHIVFIWRSSKAKFINSNFDKIFSIFSIEKSYYSPDIYDYIGHPLKNKTYYSKDYNEINNIGIFLGSRQQEIHKNILIIKKLLVKLKKYKELVFKFFVTTEYHEFIKNYFKDNSNIQIHLNDNSYYKKISKLDFAFACSGTVHLELCFSNIPHLIFYKANIINYSIFKLFVRAKYLSLVNIFNKKEIVKEFIQNDFTATNLSNFFTTLKLNKDKLYNYRKNMFDGIRSSNFENFRSSIITDYLEKSS